MAGGERREDDQRRTDAMEESIGAAHRKIDGLLGETAQALGAGDAAGALKAFTRLAEALDTHFEQEDHLYYPPIRSLRPEFKTTVDGFVAAHRLFRQDFAEIGSLLANESLAEAARALERFGQTFALHEAAEEEMLRSLNRTLDVTA